jgi:uncharacterized caspase-like protein
MYRFRNQTAAGLALAALSLFLVGNAPAQTGPIAAHRNLFVLAAGVNHPPGYPRSLNCADKDARDMVSFWATQRGRLFNRVDAAPALTNGQGTRRAILHGLARMAEASRAGDRAIVFLSGHGGVVRTGEWGFCAGDGHVLASELRPFIEQMARKGVLVLLMVDTCHAGAIAIQGENIIVMAACTAGRGAGDGNSYFTKALLEGLAGAADANKDGVITLVELEAYVAWRMEQFNREQCPTCGRSANVRSNLPLATAGRPATVAGAATGPTTGLPTGPISPQ